MNLIHLLEKAAVDRPESIAIGYPGGEITYAVFNDAVKRLAGGLIKSGLGRDDRIAISLPNVPHFAIAYYAVLRIGAVVVPIPTGLNVAGLASRLEEAEAAALICWAGDAGSVSTARELLPALKRIIMLGETLPDGVMSLTRLIARSSPLQDPSEIDDEDTALLRLTEGPAGRPFGVEFSAIALAGSATALRDAMGVEPGDNILGCLSLTSPAGEGLALTLALAAGCKLTLLPRFEPKAVLKELTTGGITIFPGLPAHFSILAEANSIGEKSPILRICISTGGVLDEEMLKEFESRVGGYVFECYIPLESGSPCSINKWRTGRRVGSIGHPLPGVEMRVIGPTGGECSIGEIGEIAVKGSGIGRGYVGRPRATRLRMRDRWFLTGDQGRMDINGFFYLAGYSDRRILRNGAIVYPFPIEAMLKAHPEVSEAVVVPTSGRHEIELKACIVPVEGATVTTDGLAAYCQARLNHDQTPSVFRFYKDLPRDKAGLVIRSELIG